MSDLPLEAEKLLAVAPDQFVAERKGLAGELREAGRSDEAAAVASMRKPSGVVFAVNRAARNRPKAAQAAAEAAERVKKTQVSGDSEAFRRALGELDEALDMLAQVALALVGPVGKSPREAMRRRIHDLLRAAVADDDAREALRRGVLFKEQEAAGFSSFAGMSVKPSRRTGRTPGKRPDDRREAQWRKREKALRDELKRAEQELQEAERAVRAAERERTKAEQALGSIRAKLDRLA